MQFVIDISQKGLKLDYASYHITLCRYTFPRCSSISKYATNETVCLFTIFKTEHLQKNTESCVLLKENSNKSANGYHFQHSKFLIQGCHKPSFLECENSLHTTSEVSQAWSQEKMNKVIIEICQSSREAQLSTVFFTQTEVRTYTC